MGRGRPKKVKEQTFQGQDGTPGGTVDKFSFPVDPDTAVPACVRCKLAQGDQHDESPTGLFCTVLEEWVGRADSCTDYEFGEPGALLEMVGENEPPIEGNEEENESNSSDTDSDASSADMDDLSLSGDPIAAEMPPSRPTTDFHLYKIRHFEHELDVGLFEVYRYLGAGGEGEPSLTVKLTGFRDSVKANIVVDLPHRVKLSVGSVETVRENGTFRIVVEPKQGSLFDQEGDDDQCQAKTEPETEMETENFPLSAVSESPNDAIASSDNSATEDTTNQGK